MQFRFDLLALPIIALAIALLGDSPGGSAGGRDSSASSRGTREACPSQLATVCFRDSAYYREDPRDPYGMPQQDWILFGNAGDSVDLLAGPEALVQTNLGLDQLANHNNAPYFRRRLRAAGVVATTVLLDINSDTNPYPYWLRVAQRSKTPNAALELTGARATVIAGTSRNLRDSFSIVPLSMLSRVKDRSTWKVRGGSWVVALVKDSLYDVCYTRCVRHDTIRLHPFQRVTIVR